MQSEPSGTIISSAGTWVVAAGLRFVHTWESRHNRSLLGKNWNALVPWMDGTVANCFGCLRCFFLLGDSLEPCIYHGSSWSVEPVIDLGCRRCGLRPARCRMCCFGHREALWLRGNAEAGGAGPRGAGAEGGRALGLGDLQTSQRH